eukprot:NODE_422_length_8880_cov_0.172759.p2 type:complete len:247 gc:universal NODE_422_length_8880_cov_0.172759:6775-7515(+)
MQMFYQRKNVAYKSAILGIHRHTLWPVKNYQSDYLFGDIVSGPAYHLPCIVIVKVFQNLSTIRDDIKKKIESRASKSCRKRGRCDDCITLSEGITDCLYFVPEPNNDNSQSWIRLTGFHQIPIIECEEISGLQSKLTTLASASSRIVALKFIRESICFYIGQLSSDIGNIYTSSIDREFHFAILTPPIWNYGKNVNLMLKFKNEIIRLSPVSTVWIIFENLNTEFNTTNESVDLNVLMDMVSNQFQ